MADVPVFTVAPPMRCFHTVDEFAKRICGARAHWTRSHPGRISPEYFCERHRVPGDEPLPLSLTFRRITIVAEIVLAGASGLQSQAQVEALERVELAVRGAGGLLNLHTVTSVIGRSRPPVPAVAGRRGSGRGCP